jgi:hypothetical protein
MAEHSNSDEAQTQNMPVRPRGGHHHEEPAEAPIRAPRVAKAAGRRAAEEQLVRRFELPPDAARAIVQAVVDPAAFRKQLDHTFELGVPGGTLLCVSSKAWAPALAPNPLNLRASPTRIYPVSDSGSVSRPLYELSTPADEKGVLLVRAESPKQVAAQAQRAAAYYLGQNNLVESISVGGVRMPVIVGALRVEHADGSASIARPVGWDGTSRITSCHEILDISSDEALYRLGGEERQLTRLINDVVALAALPEAKVGAPDRAKLRALVVPATFILAFEPDPGSELTLAGAVRALVGQIHVDPPKPWGDMAEHDACVDAGLLEMRDGKPNLGEWFHDYLAGLLSLETLEDKSLQWGPDIQWPDARAVAVTYAIMDQGPWGQAFKKGVRGVSRRGQVRRDLQAQLAAELILRSARGGPQAGRLRTAVAALERALLYPPFLEQTWHELLLWKMDAKQLRDEALRELEKQSNSAPAQRELALMALYHLVIHGGLARERPRASGGDGRMPARVLGHVLSSKRGIEFLYHVIIDGRHEITPRARDENGKLLRAAGGGFVPVSDEWLRAEFPEPGSAPAASPGKNSLNDLQARLRQLRQSVEDLEDKAASVESVLDSPNGSPLIDVEGLASDIASDLSRRLEEIRDTIKQWGWTFSKRVAGVTSGESAGEDAI